MDAWRNAQDIKSIQEELSVIKKHLISLTQLMIDNGKKDKPEKVSKPEPKSKPVEPELEKKGWFGRTRGDKDEGVQSKQNKT